MATTAMNVVAMQRGGHRYVFMYDESRESRMALYGVMRKFAANRLLPFTVEDARQLARRAIMLDRQSRIGS